MQAVSAFEDRTLRPEGLTNAAMAREDEQGG